MPQYGFTGREPDATGLIYYRARYYMPEIGRFTQADPLGYVDGINRYVYAINNPVNFTDPWGLSVAKNGIPGLPSGIAAGMPYTPPDAYSNFDPVSNSINTVLSYTVPGYAFAQQAQMDFKAGNYGMAVLNFTAGLAEAAVAGFTLGQGQGVSTFTRAVSTNISKETTTVGRWMSKAEHQAMQKTGKVQESYSGTTHVANPAQAESFLKQAAPGCRYVEFDVPTASLKQTSEGWAKIIGPSSLEGRLAAKKGLSVPQMPNATDIIHRADKLP